MARRWHVLHFALALCAVVSLGVLVKPAPASALSGSQFAAGRIIDDFVFKDKNSMSVLDIQNFLNSKVPVCDTNGVQSSGHWYTAGNRYYTRAEWGALNGEPAPFFCLKDYYENPTTKANNLHGATIPGGGLSAARLIWDVAQEYNINPKVILVLLQKEQSLVTDDWPFTTQYRSATGYGCPDTAPCASQYYGFYNQISNAAWQFNYYATNPQLFNFKANVTRNIQYNPNASCGSGAVALQNQATAGLYNYTPYQPNAAALANLYGTGDSCSAYGNRNFWRMYSDWFGTTFANDTFTAHPNGTVIANHLGIFLIKDNAMHFFTHHLFFESYGYKWSEIRKASTGDYTLPYSTPIDTPAPGTLFYSDNTPLYIMTTVGGVPMKQHMSLNSFNVLGYSWSEAQYFPPWLVPAATAPGMYVSEKHPPGTVVLPYGVGKLYVMTETGKRWVMSPLAFDTNHLSYAHIKGATLSDIVSPEEAGLDVAQGTILFNNGIYVVDYDGGGIMKRPLGPWECYTDRLNYSWTNWVPVSVTGLPARTGPLFTC